MSESSLDGEWAVGLPCRRDEEGWEGQAALGQGPEEGAAPETVMPVDRYLQDLEYLRELTSTVTPPKQLYRAVHQSAFFVIGDASGKAKGDDPARDRTRDCVRATRCRGRTIEHAT